MHEAVERLEQQGYDAVSAEREAVRRFGSPEEVAAAGRRASRPTGALAAVGGVATGLAALSFAGATAFLGGQAVDLAVQHGSGGVGWYLSGAIVAAIAIVPCAVSTRRSLQPLIRVSYVPEPMQTAE